MDRYEEADGNQYSEDIQNILEAHRLALEIGDGHEKLEVVGRSDLMTNLAAIKLPMEVRNKGFLPFYLFSHNHSAATVVNGM